jgi:hypothetical protein
MVFGGTAALDHTGVLDGTVPVAIDSTADLKAVGEMSATADLAFVATGVMAFVVQNQIAFRFGKDDGSESAHTWWEAENTNVDLDWTRTAILRIGVDNEGDADFQQLKLQVKQTGDPDSSYQDVPVA